MYHRLVLFSQLNSFPERGVGGEDFKSYFLVPNTLILTFVLDAMGCYGTLEAAD